MFRSGPVDGPIIKKYIVTRTTHERTHAHIHTHMHIVNVNRENNIGVNSNVFHIRLIATRNHNTFQIINLFGFVITSNAFQIICLLLPCP